jgi:excisionase family DNA binding protein
MDTKSDGEDAAPDFMTAAEVAAWFRVGVSTVYGWVSNGRIPFLRLNGIVRFSRQQLTGWMQQHTKGPSLSSDQVSERVIGAHPRPLSHRTMEDAAARVKRRLLPSKNPIHHGDGH